MTGGGTTAIHYRGHTFTVPADWKVVDLDKNPATCVRFDRHAVYLGTPGARQDCPADVTGRTEALLVRPSNATKAAVTENPTSRTYSATAAEHHRHGSATAPTLPGSGGCSPVPGCRWPRRGPRRRPPRLAALAVPADATSYQGNGFDACAAPSQAAMNAWKGSSGYGAVGVYIGGENRGCSQANLDAQWVQTQYTNGWRFLPI
ncbi:glycoside hydrolase domain-containing protein [Streptomyces lasalocidi]